MPSSRATSSAGCWSNCWRRKAARVTGSKWPSASSLGGTADITDCLVALNRATGGGGGLGAGGGGFNGRPTALGTPTLTLVRSLVALNRADGGPSGTGLGGGLYLAPGGV